MWNIVYKGERKGHLRVSRLSSSYRDAPASVRGETLAANPPPPSSAPPPPLPRRRQEAPPRKARPASTAGLLSSPFARPRGWHRTAGSAEVLGSRGAQRRVGGWPGRRCCPLVAAHQRSGSSQAVRRLRVVPDRGKGATAGLRSDPLGSGPLVVRGRLGGFA